MFQSSILFTLCFIIKCLDGRIYCSPGTVGLDKMFVIERKTFRFKRLDVCL